MKKLNAEETILLLKIYILEEASLHEMYLFNVLKEKGLVEGTLEKCGLTMTGAEMHQRIEEATKH